MTVSPWPDSGTALQETDRLRGELRAEQETNLLLTENLADLQLALEDKGWQSIATAVNQDFTPEARKALISLCRTMAISNPLIKRGLVIRTGYVWGRGVEIRARANGDDQTGSAGTAGQDVNAVVQAFLDTNTATLSGDVAHEQLEKGLGTDGDVYLTCFTNPLTGGVQVRASLAEEVVDIITNPDDRDDPWYYVRHVPQRVVEPGASPATTRTRQQVVKVAHPAVGFWPRSRPKTLDGMTVRWDAPILHVRVNTVPGWRFGVPDVYASVSWARAYKDFLVDWAQLTRSLSQYAWQATAGTASRAGRMAQEIARGRQAQVNGPGVGQAPPVGVAPAAGQAAVGTPDVKLEAISKSGATIDSNSGKPLAGMAAAGLGLPVTMLLADPGVTGARAVAETLDLPTVLEMGMRRLLWQSAFTRLIGYAIDQAVIAPRGPLRGSMVRDDWGRLTTTLAGDDGAARTLEFDWPPLTDTDPVALIGAIAEAAGTDLVPDLVLLRLLLSALGVKDADEVIEQVTDDQGQFVPPNLTAAMAAVDSQRRTRSTADDQAVAVDDTDDDGA